MKKHLHPVSFCAVLFLLIFQFQAVKTSAQCVNADFSMGNFTGWTATYGKCSGAVIGGDCICAGANPTANVGFLQGPLNVASNSGTQYSQTIVSTGNDATLSALGVTVPCVYPGNAYSARLGCTFAAAEGESMTYSFLVTPNNCNFTYHYAVVLEDGGHAANIAPFFHINVFDGSNNAITCADFQVDGSHASTIGFSYVLSGTDTVHYKNWTSVFVPLNNYIGQTVKITFTTESCYPSGTGCGGPHYAYAYVAAECGPLQILSSSPTVCGGSSVTLTAPAGAATYSWSGPGVVAPVNAQTVTINQPGHYTCNMTTFGNPPCPFSLDTVMAASPSNPAANFSATTVCAGAATTFTDLSIPAGGVNAWAWDFNNTGTTNSTSQNPTYTFPTAGTYPVKLTITWPPCQADTTINVTVTPPPTSTFTATGPVCAGQNSTVTYTGSATAGATYTWGFSGGTVASGSGQGPYQVNWATSGSQNVTLSVTENGCSSSTTTNPVTVNPSPTSVFTATSPVCTGQNSTVTYGGTPSGTASYTWVFNGATLVSGAGAGPYVVNWPTAGTKVLTLSVTDAGCTSTLDSQLVVVNAYPTATFTATSPVCAFQNSTITFTGSASANATYHWNFSGGTLVSGSGAGPYQVNWGTAGNENVTLSVTDNGCTSTLTTVPVTVNPTPSASFTTNTPICTGQTSTITYTGTGTGAAVYNWSFDGGTIISGATQGPYVIGWTTAGNKNVTLAVTENGCTSPITDSIVVVNLTPVAAFTLVPAAACVGQTSTATFTGTADNAAVYAWNFGGGTVVSGTGNGPYVIGWSMAGSLNVTLSITDNGCLSNDTSMPITVNTPPTSDAGTDVSFCSGDSAAIGSATTVGYTYAWTPANGLSDATISNPNADGTNNTAATTVTKYLVTTTSNGCSTSDSVNVTIYPLPVASFTPPTGECLTGNSFNFVAVGTYLPNATFAWDFGANGTPATSTLANQAVSFSAAGQQTVTLIISQNGCVSNTFTGNVNVFAMPVPAFVPDNISGCPGLKVCFTNNSTGTAPTTYQWQFGNGQSSTAQAPCNVYSAPGIYSVQLMVQSADGCDSSTTMDSLITVIPNPVAAFIPAGATIQLPVDTITLYNTSSNATSYAWNFGVLGNSTDLNPLLTFTLSGVYPVVLTVGNGTCIDSVEHDILVLPPVAFFIPNVFTPNADGRNDLFYIEAQEGVTVYRFAIFDRWGEKVHDGAYPWDGTFKGKPCQEGVYVYEVTLTLAGQTDGVHRKGTVTLLK